MIPSPCREFCLTFSPTFLTQMVSNAHLFMCIRCLLALAIIEEDCGKSR